MKKISIFVISFVFVLIFSTFAFAGSWKNDAKGWYYEKDDGTYANNGWHWIDSNNDGTAESYYFDASGYCLMNTTTPDGYTVDVSGAWIVDGIIQTQTVPSTTKHTEAVSKATTSGGISSTPFNGYTIVVNTNTKKYHSPTCSSVKDINASNIGYSADVSYLESQGYIACKKCH